MEIDLKPKIKTSAYMYFCSDLRRREPSRHLKLSDLSIMWNNLKDDPSKKRELQYYLNLAQKDSERYDREITAYREKNKEALLLMKSQKKEEIKIAKKLEKLRSEEKKIQEQMRSLESKISRPVAVEQSRKKEIDMSLILKKIQNEKKQTREDKPKFDDTSSNYSSDSDDNL